MSNIDPSTWNPDWELNEQIEGIPLDADASILDSWKAFRMLMAAIGTHGQTLIQKVSGPSSSVDEHIVLFDGTSGLKLKDSGVSLSDIGTSAFTGATASAAGTMGLVPQPLAGDQGKVLRGDGTWGSAPAAVNAGVLEVQAHAAAPTGNLAVNGLQAFAVYNDGNGYPTAFGNVINIQSNSAGSGSSGYAGAGQLLLGWSGTTNGVANLYYRNKRDNQTTWSDWKQIAFTDSDITGTAATATKVDATAATGSMVELVRAMMAGNDVFRIAVGDENGTDTGYVEIATGDNGTEPIYVRQYSGNNYGFINIARTLTLLDASGNSIFPGTVTAPKVVANGPLDIFRDNPWLVCYDTDLTRGTNPSVTNFQGIYGTDKDGSATTHRVGCCEFSVDTEGNTNTYLRAYKWEADSSSQTAVTVTYPKTGLPYTTVDKKLNIVGDHPATDTEAYGLHIKGGRQNFAIAIQTDRVTKGTAPSAGVNSAIDFYGATMTKYQDRLANIENTVYTNGRNRMAMRAFDLTSSENYEFCEISCNVDGDGRQYTFAPTPPAGDNSTQIATTAFVNTKCANYLPLSGGTLTGRLSQSYNSPAIAWYDTDLTKGTNPSSNQWFGLYACDKTGDASGQYRVGSLEFLVDSSGNARSHLRTYNWTAGATGCAEFRITHPKGGTPYADINCKFIISGEHFNASSTNTPTPGLLLNGGAQNYAICIQTDKVTKGTAPSANVFSAIDFYGTAMGSDSNRLANIENRVSPNNVNMMTMRAYNLTSAGNTAYCGITCYVDAEGNAYTSAPTPAAGDNSTKIATTAFVNTKCGSYLPLSGGTLTNNLRISASTPRIIYSHTDVTKGTNPSSSKYWNIAFGENGGGGSNSTRLGMLETTLGADGVVATRIQAFKNEADSSVNASIGVFYDKTNNIGYTYAPTPAVDDNSTKIATTAWCRTATGNFACNAATATKATQDKNGLQIDTGYLKLSGGYMAADLKVLSTYARVDCFFDSITKGTNPTSNRYGGIYICDSSKEDSTAKRVAVCEGSLSTSGDTTMYIRAYDWTASSSSNVAIGVVYPKGGTGYTYAPTPAASDNSTKIATTAWVRTHVSSGSSSDERLKTPLSEVPDEVLDAWEAVELGQFKFLEAVEEKGEKARLHLGLVAQQVLRVFNEHGLDACRYGILCHETSVLEQDSIDEWTVRYTEALCIEAMYQRRRADRLEARVAAIEETMYGQHI